MRSTSSLRAPVLAVMGAGFSAVTASRSGARRQPAEAALAPVEFQNGVLERAAVEFGPIDRQEHRPALGPRPPQEIRHALLAPGAGDGVGVRAPGAVGKRPRRSPR